MIPSVGNKILREGESPGLSLSFDDIANADLMIGGDSADVADWNTFFDLPTNGTAFGSVVVDGDTVKLYGGSEITLKAGLFVNGDSFLNLISIVDSTNCIIGASFADTSDPGINDEYWSPFYYLLFDYNTENVISRVCSNLITANLPSLETAGNYCFCNCSGLMNTDFSSLITAGKKCFYGCFGLANIDFSTLINAGDYCFFSCSMLVNTDFSSLETAGDYCFCNCSGLINPDFSSLETGGEGCFNSCSGLVNIDFSLLITAGSFCFNGCSSLTSLGLPVCTILGITTGDDNVFNGITGKTITLTIPHALESDGDVIWLKARNTVTVVYSD
jgi:hypothetical protein